MTTQPAHPEIQDTISESMRVASALEELTPKFAEAAEIILESLRSGGRLLAIGNGGSAAQAQHLAAEMVGRFESERQPLPALSLTTDTSAITAIGNDYGFPEIFARQLRALARPGDVVLAISTSGNSPNVLRGLDAAREIGLRTIGLTGRTGGQMISRVDLCLCAASDSTPRIQEAHLLISHILCSLVESACFGDCLRR
jgi:D-sedoheptulose 7-phosphate isomerase